MKSDLDAPLETDRKVHARTVWRRAQLKLDLLQITLYVLLARMLVRAHGDSIAHKVTDADTDTHVRHKVRNASLRIILQNKISYHDAG